MDAEVCVAVAGPRLQVLEDETPESRAGDLLARVKRAGGAQRPEHDAIEEEQLRVRNRNHTDRARWSIDFRYHASAAALPAGSREREITAAWDDKCRALGTEPLTVVSEGPLPTWAEWDAARGAREAEFAARQAAAVAGAS